MELKKAEKISKYLAELKELDAKVNELGKIANMANEQENELKIQLSCGKQPSVVVSNTYTFSIWGSAPSVDGEEWKQKAEDKKDSFASVTELLDSKHFFIFCEFMMGKYNARREYLVNKIETILK
jgi:hypothetical protein